MSLEPYQRFNPFMKSVKSIVDETLDAAYKVELHPQYQRELIWTSYDQSCYIDSILEGYAPSTIVFSKDRKTGVKTCIDGQHRITSLINFTKNKIPVYHKDRKYYYKQVPDDEEEEAEVLPPLLVSEFNRAYLNITEYADLTYEQQKDLFNRIQNGIKGNKAPEPKLIDFDKFREKYATTLNRYKVQDLDKIILCLMLSNSWTSIKSDDIINRTIKSIDQKTYIKTALFISNLFSDKVLGMISQQTVLDINIILFAAHKFIEIFEHPKDIDAKSQDIIKYMNELTKTYNKAKLTYKNPIHKSIHFQTKMDSIHNAIVKEYPLTAQKI